MVQSKIEIAITARPSWARVKSLVENLAMVLGRERLSVCLIGPSLSEKHGDIKYQLPKDIRLSAFRTLQNDSELGSVALTALHGGIALARHWEQTTPASVLVVADRTETLGVSSTAAIMQIPIIHLQGGEISGTIDDKIRDTNSKLADLHLTTNETSRRRIISLGEPEELIHIIGCPSIDIVKRVIETGHQPNWYSMDGVGCAIDQHDEFGIIMFHPDTLNIVESLEWVDLLIRLVERSSIKWFWFWPNPDHGSDKVSKILRKSREIGKLKNVRFVINLSPEDFIAVALYSSIFLGNSSFGIRESGYMGLPSITTGQRQRGRDKSLNVQSIEEPQFEVLMDVFNQLLGKKFAKSTLYGDGNSGRLGAEIISTWNPRPKVRKIYH